MTKLAIVVIFGGRSLEHRVSLDSAEWVLSWLDTAKYDVLPLWIFRSGECVSGEQAWNMLMQEAGGYTWPSDNGLLRGSVNVCTNIISHINSLDHKPDVFFPLIHGAHGEDGRLQWMLDLLWIPYIGSGVVWSAICMDKILTKNILASAGIRQLPYFGFTLFEWRTKTTYIHEHAESLWYPLFVKPANGGSSIGISKVKNASQLHELVEEAFLYDIRVLLEKALEYPRELEVAVIGNDDIFVTRPGENIVDANHEFYTYEAKYIDDNSNFVQVPALDISESLSQQIQNDARKAFYSVNARWIARVDFFLDRADGLLYLNEINTMPELTRYSIYPKLLEMEGYTFEQMLDRLIHLAV